MARAIPVQAAFRSRDYELHAKNVYFAEQTNRPVAPGWTYLEDIQFPKALLHDPTGLDAALYQSGAETALAFAGTNIRSWVDLRTDIAQFAGVIPRQYLRGLELADNA